MQHTAPSPRTFLLRLLFVLGISLGTHAAAAGEFQKQKLSIGNDVRTYGLYVPDRMNGRPAPLLVALHGGLGSAEKFFNSSTLRQMADREHVVLLFPESMGKAWIDARDENRASDQDVEFIERLVDHVKQSNNIDPKYIYLTGLSSGGVMTLRMAIQKPGLFTGFAAVNANLSEYMLHEMHSSTPVSILLINGSADTLMPYGGGQVGGGFGRNRLGKVISAPDTAAFWARVGGCSSEPATVAVPEKDPSDGTRVTRREFQNCNEGASVVAMTIEGGGHSWPGAKKRSLPAAMVGPLTNEIDAADAVWEFFNTHTRTAAR